MKRLLNESAIRSVLTFVLRQWRHESRIVLAVILNLLIATSADLLLPLFSGKLVDAITVKRATHSEALHSALVALSIMAASGAVLVLSRHFAMLGINRLTLRLMSKLISGVFWRIQ